MSIFNVILPKLDEISNAFTKNWNDFLKTELLSLDKSEEEYLNPKSKARDKSQKDKNISTLQSIHEDEALKPSESITTEERSKKRSKNEVEGMESPELQKRQKRNASVKAQSIITKQMNGTITILDDSTLSQKQININLNEKLRQENSTQKRRRRKDDDKENEPETIVQIKQEKMSLPLESVDIDSTSVKLDIKKEVNEEIAMPPPPVPKTRKKAEKQEEASDEDTGRRRTTRNRKQTDVTQLNATRSVRSSRARLTEQEDKEGKRKTRGRKAQETSTIVTEREAATINQPESPADKPRPKRTRKAKKVSEKPEIEKKTENEVDKDEPQKEVETEPIESIADHEIRSPVLQKIKPKAAKKINTNNERINVANDEIDETDSKPIDDGMDKAKAMTQLNCTVTINNNMDRTVVLPTAAYNDAPVATEALCQMNETVVLESNKEGKQKEKIMNETVVLESNKEGKQKEKIMNETVVLESNKEGKQKEKIMNETVVLSEVSDKAKISPAHDSLMTDDDSLEMHTPPKTLMPEPTSAVKEKVQKFEELASRVTRTKTRAMAKKEEPTKPDNQTPPDRTKPAQPDHQTPLDRTKPVISTDTLTKMNNLIFNGKAAQISLSASKPRTNIPMRTAPSSASKISVTREDEGKEREDARRKKEAMLEAKREMQRRKREEKMSAAAAARTVAENMRRAAQQAAEKERRDRQILADHGRQERLKEVEKKKLEQARKAAETEERRKMEEAARANRLQQEQKKMEEAKKRQLEEEKIMKKEAAQMQKEIERRQREFMERMKMKKMEENRTSKKIAAMEPVYMQDGFQYLNSDEEEPPERPPPVWSTTKNRRLQLSFQSRVSQEYVDKLFSVREHTPDLREIFPNIERARLKRTSSAVWRTPPRMPTLEE